MIPQREANDAFEVDAVRMADLQPLTEYVDASCRSAGVDEDASFAVRLAVEEAFTNVVQHGYGSATGPLTVRIESADGAVTVTMIDRAPRFDRATAAAPDLEAPWEERALGGLGWHLVEQLMDDVELTPNPAGGNILKLVKRFEPNGTRS